MPAQPAELWAFYLSAAVVVAILVLAVGAAVIVSQRKLTMAARDFAARQVEALEEERSRVARELHDDVSQQIAILSHRLDAIHENLRGQGADAAVLDEADTVGDGLRDLATTVRALAHQMHPSALDHLGLGPALRSLAQEAAAVMGIEMQVDVPDTAGVAPDHALALYRVAQESLRNVAKHSNAGRVMLRVAETERGTLLEIADDGVGFQPLVGSPGGGLGLTSMRERLRMIGGELSVVSSPGKGTGIRAWVPRENGAGG
jgi:signal transduction histidine kinase